MIHFWSLVFGQALSDLRVSVITKYCTALGMAS
jgi:hypothetical protein